MSKTMREILRNTVEDVKENVSLGNILHDIGKEVKEQAQHGAHEVAAALFNGNGFVMYQKGDKEQENAQQQSIEPLKEQEQERGGMEM